MRPDNLGHQRESQADASTAGAPSPREKRRDSRSASATSTPPVVGGPHLSSSHGFGLGCTCRGCDACPTALSGSSMRKRRNWGITRTSPCHDSLAPVHWDDALAALTTGTHDALSPPLFGGPGAGAHHARLGHVSLRRGGFPLVCVEGPRPSRETPAAADPAPGAQPVSRSTHGAREVPELRPQGQARQRRHVPRRPGRAGASRHRLRQGHDHRSRRGPREAPEDRPGGGPGDVRLRAEGVGDPERPRLRLPALPRHGARAVPPGTGHRDHGARSSRSSTPA